MAYSKEQNRQDITELQTYLLNISHFIDSIPSVIPDGFYGEKTKNAVEAFQREYGLPVTGEVDKKTWDTIVIVYKHFVKNPPEPIDIFPKKDYILKLGDRNYLVYILQIMLRAISEKYPSVPSVAITGTYSPETVEAVRFIQTLSRFPKTGDTDKYTWNNIVHMFHHSVK